MTLRSSRPDRRLRLHCANRDGWVCRRCLQPINPALPYPHPMSLSLEHLVELAAGGPSDPRNCTVSHLRCNQSAGATFGNRRRSPNHPTMRTSEQW